MKNFLAPIAAHLLPRYYNETNNNDPTNPNVYTEWFVDCEPLIPEYDQYLALILPQPADQSAHVQESYANFAAAMERLQTNIGPLVDACRAHIANGVPTDYVLDDAQMLMVRDEMEQLGSILQNAINILASG